MESLGNILKATGRRVPSKTYRSEERVCTRCLHPFAAKIATVDGVEQEPPKECPVCIEHQERVDKEADAALKLRVATDATRDDWRRRCGMQGDLLDKSFDNFEVTRQPKVFELVKGHDLGESLILCSYPNKQPDTARGEKYSDGYGLGKTHLLAALANRILSDEPAARLCQGYYIQALVLPIHWTTEPDMLARITATYRDGAIETEEGVFRHLTLVKYLFIDDVAKYQPKDLNFVQRVFYRVINARSLTHKPIFMTANLGKAGLEEYIGGASADRLRGMCGQQNIVTMTGKSYRRQG